MGVVVVVLLKLLLLLLWFLDLLSLFFSFFDRQGLPVWLAAFAFSMALVGKTRV